MTAAPTPADQAARYAAALVFALRSTADDTKRDAWARQADTMRRGMAAALAGEPCPPLIADGAPHPFVHGWHLANIGKEANR